MFNLLLYFINFTLNYLNFNCNVEVLDFNVYIIESIKSNNFGAIKMKYDENSIVENNFLTILLDNVLKHIEKLEKLICKMFGEFFSEVNLLILFTEVKCF